MRCGILSLLVILAAGLSGQNVTRSGIHPEDMDRTCKPCTDFWRFANGGWLDKNPIPAHLASWGSFTVLNEANQERERTILEAAATNPDSGSPNQRKMGDIYGSCMDTAAIDARGLAPLQPDFDRIDAIKSVADLNAVLAWFQRVGRPFSDVNGVVVGPFRITSGLDPKNPTREVALIVERDRASRSGTSILSLPDRDYYFKDDQKSRDIRDAFVQHVTKMMGLTGATALEAANDAKVVLGLETSLASSVMKIADKRNPENTDHPIDLAGLQALAPNYDWALFIRELGLPESTAINVTEPALLAKANELLKTVPLDDWKVWLRWRALQTSAAFLAKPFSDESFYFGRTVLAGVKDQPPRWQSCAAIVDRTLPDALGEAYSAKYFPPEAKRRMGAMVENLRAALKDELTASDWMDPATKKSAMTKLATLQVQIGYPDRWKDYAAVPISRRSYFENVRAAWTFQQHYEISLIGKPVDHVDWDMTTPTVNAYSSVQHVKVVFPAGILQPPFFDMQADDAVNYGAIGAVIGHEIGHQFDDGGSKYDNTGALRNWWTDADRAKFEARTGCVVDQFNALDLGDGLRHNGKQVLGEALGDLGGVNIAYKAWKRSLGGKSGVTMDGYTPDQRFFIAFARVWGTQIRPEAARLQVNTDNHPVSHYRAVGTLQNIPEFARAFQCKDGDPMVRPAAQRCKLW